MMSPSVGSASCLGFSHTAFSQISFSSVFLQDPESHRS